MSAETRGGWFGTDADDAAETGYRAAALASVAALTYAYASVLYHVTDVVGGTEAMLAILGGSVVAGAAFGRFVRPRWALFITVVLGAAGGAAYFLAIPESQLALLSVDRIVSDTVALLTGLSVLRLTAAGVWAMAIAPGPVFISWYFAVRGRYVWSVVAGGAALSLFVLTGDAGTVTTLVGVGGATAAVGFGTLERWGGAVLQLDTLAMVLAAMVVLSATLSVVPGGGTAGPLVPDRGSPTGETNLVNASEEVTVQGSIRLSPKVRFTVESDSPHYWRTGGYDRYTGKTWVRTGDARQFDGRLSGPPGRDRSVEQTVTAKTSLGVLPAAWKPVGVEGPVAEGARVTREGGLGTAGTIDSGTTFTVHSEVPEYTAEGLREAGTDYPDRVEERYLGLPDSTPERVERKAAEVAGDEDNAYDKARAIEQYLESNKRYSLTVEQPDGNVADTFLFEMDAGYCVYYATTMAVMLRAEGVPARFATGYTTGQQVGDGEYVVRGLNSHAWVEVYFPETGWVRFDPTPSGPRESAERARVAEARAAGESNVDTNGTRPTTETPTAAPETATATPETSTAGTAGTAAATATPASDLGSGGVATTTPDDDGWVPDLPSRRTTALGLVALMGVVAGAHRSGATSRLYRAVWLRYQRPGENPTTDAERAYARLEYLLGRQYRERRPTESPRAYLDALSRQGVDERAVEVARIYERARYGDGATREEADRAVALVDELVSENTPVVGQLR